MQKRVVITGVGSIASNGLNTKEVWSNLKKGVSGVREIDFFDTKDIPVKFSGSIENFNIEDYGFSPEYKKYDRCTQLGLATAELALQDAELLSGDYNRRKVGVIIGNAGGSLVSTEKIFDKLVKEQVVTEDIEKSHFRILISRVIAKHYNLSGINQIISTGCTSGLDSVGMAMEAIRNNEADIIIAGGVEAPITPATICAFAKIGALSERNDSPTEASRPYEKSRDGFVLAEGSGLVIMENLEHALARGAKIYGEVMGFSTNCSAYHMTGMPSDGKPISDVIIKALEDANVNPLEIDYINAHGSSTPMNDVAETNAYKKVFGDEVYKKPISSIKSMLGHSLGAIGGIEVVVCALSIQDQIVPPTINLDIPDDECDLDYVPNKARKVKVDKILTNGSGFSGLNSAIIMGQYKEVIK